MNPVALLLYLLLRWSRLLTTLVVQLEPLIQRVCVPDEKLDFSPRYLVIHAESKPFVPSGILRYGDGAGNTVEENSIIFSLIRMR